MIKKISERRSNVWKLSTLNTTTGCTFIKDRSNKLLASNAAPNGFSVGVLHNLLSKDVTAKEYQGTQVTLSKRAINFVSYFDAFISAFC